MQKILWADDEIDLLKPHILFLQKKGYEIATVSNGRDAIDALDAEPFSLVLLDENMPGLTGLETLQIINKRHPDLPVIMITKSEEENIMDQAIGSRIADYLIKPVNPNQILLALKKNLDKRDLVAARTNTEFMQDFRQLSMDIEATDNINDWYELYRSLVTWEMKISAAADAGISEIFESQKKDANKAFCRFVCRNYEEWVNSDSRPMMSHDIFKTKVFPLLDKGEKVFFVLIDNFRLDQWRTIQPLMAELFNISEELYTTILPTSTQYARNSIFAGLMPLKISQMFPQYWVDEDEDEGLNVYEKELLQTMLSRYRRKETFSYEKIYNSENGEKLLRKINSLAENPLNVLVINFIDMLSHARTESKMIRELASSDAAYRSITESWFRHSSVMEIFRRIRDLGYKVILTTDHGTVKVDNPIKVVGDKNTSTNLRYKEGKNLKYNAREVYQMRYPNKFGLPMLNVSSEFIFAMNGDFFAYPNNYNYYVQYYRGTFQHGGISMQEMLVPLITLDPK
jgi:CheY-like chemotaxis protein